MKCEEAASEGMYLFVAHNGRFRNVIPYKVTPGYFFCYCTLHPERDVEKWALVDTSDASVSEDKVYMLPPWDGDFAY
jgi:hypothetical protein